MACRAEAAAARAWPVAATWWRTLATAAAPRPQLSHKRPHRGVVADAETGVLEGHQFGVAAGGAQHGAVMVAGVAEQHRLAAFLETGRRVRRQASSDSRAPSRPINRPRCAHAATAVSSSAAGGKAARSAISNVIAATSRMPR